MGLRSMDYTHYVPAVKENPSLGDKFSRILIGDLSEVTPLPEKYFLSWDLETSGLNPEECFIVGVSFTFDGKTGYYLPIKHVEGKYLGIKGLEWFYSIVKKADSSIVYNMRFDFRFMEYAGFCMKGIPYCDVMVNTWLSDTNIPMPKLKDSCLHFIGWTWQTFGEVLGEVINASYLTPAQIYTYATNDALGTWHLGLATMKYMKEAGFGGKLHQKVCYPLMKFEDRPVRMNKKHFEVLTQETLARVEELRKKVRESIGYDFDLNSGKQISEALSSKGYINENLVKSGYMKTDISNIEKLYKEYGDPVLKDIVEYKTTFKAYNSYMKTFKDQLETRDSLRFSYLNMRVPTGRLASGSEKRNSYFGKINVQCVVGDTVIYLSTGVTTMERLKKGSSVWDGDGFTRVVAKYENGRQEVYRVILASGVSIKCTKEHQFYSSTKGVGFRRLSKLKVGDLVAISSEPFSAYSDTEREVEKNNCELVWSPIESIGYCGFDDVFDIYTESGQYVANTIVVHNSTPQAHRRLWSVYEPSDLREDMVEVNGWGFLPQEGSDKVVEGATPQLNVRRGFIPEEGHYWVTVDFSAQEIRLPAVLSGEPTWLNAFLTGEDLHRSTAIKIWGEEKYNKEYRRRAKVMNFCETDRNFVLTDRGYKRPSQITPDHYLVSPNGDEVSHRLIVKRDQPCLEILFNNGIIGRYHEQHRLLVLDENKCTFYWVPVNELTSEHTIVCQPQFDRVPELEKEIFMGRVLGPSLESGKFTSWNIEEINKVAHVCLARGFCTMLREVRGEFVLTIVEGSGFRGVNNWKWKIKNRLGKLEETYPVTMLHKTAVTDTIYAFEVPGHQYISNSMISHNSLLYGGNYRTLTEKLKIPEVEAMELEKEYKKALKVLFAWVDRHCKKARRVGTVYTYFGTPRRVKGFFASSEARTRAFGYRTAVNTAIQGGCSDILRIVLLRLWKNLLDHPDYRDDIRFLITIHDEINFSIKKERLEEIMPIIVSCMEIQPQGWPIKMEVGIEIGNDWGTTFAFKTKDGKLVPSFDIVESEEEEQMEEVFIEEVYLNEEGES